ACAALSRLMRTRPATASLAASERDFTARAKNSHLSMRWRPAATMPSRTGRNGRRGGCRHLLLQLVAQGGELGEGRIRIEAGGAFLARLALESRLAALPAVLAALAAVVGLALAVRPAMAALALFAIALPAPALSFLRPAAAFLPAALLFAGLLIAT